MIRTTSIAFALLFASTAASAEPVMLSDGEMDNVIAGFTINPRGTAPISIALNNAGTGGNDLLVVSGTTLPDAPSDSNALWNGHQHAGPPNNAGDPHGVVEN